MLPEKPFIVSIASRDGSAMPDSIATLKDVAEILKRPFVRNFGHGTGLAATRNACMAKLREASPGAKELYVFWLDSDIVIEEDPATIAKYVLEAEEKGVSFTGAYCSLNPDTHEMGFSVSDQDGLTLSQEKLKEYASEPFRLRCKYSGLGLCYLKMPMDYTFRTSGMELEDRLFLIDNPQVDVRYVPIANIHNKLIRLRFR